MGLGSCFSLALLALSLSLLTAPGRAEPADQPKPAKQLKVMETPRGLLEAANFGEMLGLPDWMAMSLSLVSQPMGNITGSKQRTFRSIDMQAIDWSLGSGLSKEDSDKDEFDRWSFRSSLAELRASQKFCGLRTRPCLSPVACLDRSWPAAVSTVHGCGPSLRMRSRYMTWPFPATQGSSCRRRTTLLPVSLSCPDLALAHVCVRNDAKIS